MLSLALGRQVLNFLICIDTLKFLASFVIVRIKESHDGVFFISEKKYLLKINI